MIYLVVMICQCLHLFSPKPRHVRGAGAGPTWEWSSLFESETGQQKYKAFLERKECSSLAGITNLILIISPFVCRVTCRFLFAWIRTTKPCTIESCAFPSVLTISHSKKCLLYHSVCYRKMCHERGLNPHHVQCSVIFFYLTLCI